MINDELYHCVLDALEKCDGKCLDNEDERDAVSETVVTAVKQWFANS